jgi:putative component of toxin-antitoxin plasmid stabilization module
MTENFKAWITESEGPGSTGDHQRPRILRISAGNFWNCKSVGEGISELVSIMVPASGLTSSGEGKRLLSCYVGGEQIYPERGPLKPRNK